MQGQKKKEKQKAVQKHLSVALETHLTKTFKPSQWTCNQNAHVSVQPLCCHTLAHNVPLSQVNGEISWPHSHFSFGKCSVAFAFGKKRATISIFERQKRWRLLASQTAVILLATVLLFLSSYLISVPLWLGGIVREENEETAFMAVFSFYRLLHRKRYWKAFMPHLQVPLFHPLICLKQFSQSENTGHSLTHNELKLPLCWMVT